MTTMQRPAVASMSTMSDARWQADLFESRHGARLPATRDRVSARGAFQDALYGRALILDLRDDAERLAAGAAPADLALVVRPGVDLAAHAGHCALYLFVGEHDGAVVDIVEPAQFAAFHPGRPRIAIVDGGFAAWRADGLPVVQPAA